MKNSSRYFVVVDLMCEVHSSSVERLQAELNDLRLAGTEKGKAVGALIVDEDNIIRLSDCFREMNARRFGTTIIGRTLGLEARGAKTSATSVRRPRA